MDTLKRKLNRKDGFTLVELLVVISIIAILSVTAFVSLGGQTDKARNARRQQDLGAIQSALEVYAVNNNNEYPAALTDLVTANLMPEIPVDPSSDDGLIPPYKYVFNGTNRKYNLAATLVDDVDGSYSSYVIGNGTGIFTNDGIQGSTCGAAETACTVADDGGTNCVPYCP